MVDKQIEEVTREEFSDWENHPVTRAFFNRVREQRDVLAEQVLSGAYLGDDRATQQRVISVMIYDQLLNTEYGEDRSDE